MGRSGKSGEERGGAGRSGEVWRTFYCQSSGQSRSYLGMRVMEHSSKDLCCSFEFGRSETSYVINIIL